VQNAKLPANLYAFQSLLEAEGEMRGLIGPKETNRIFTRHILNSLTLLNFLPVLSDSSKPLTFLDVGSGAGFPGVPIAIMRPDLRVTLLESMQKRIDWLALVKSELHLDNVKLLHGNSRDFINALHADYITARAVAPLDKLIPLLVPFRSKHSKIVLPKGANVKTELQNASKQIKKAGLNYELHENVVPDCVSLGDEIDVTEVATNILVLS
jgi:16S rRNA (guanine527-N7)-methyltransferase